MGVFGRVTGVLACLAAVGTLPSAAQAQEAVSAASEIPEIIPTSAFAARSQLSSARLSPDGSRFAFTTLREDKLYISVVDAATREIVSSNVIGDRDIFNWFRWAGNDRILLSVTLTNSHETYNFSRLLALELGTQRAIPLLLPRMAYDGDDIVHIDDEGRFVLISMSPGLGRYPAVWRFDLENVGEEAPRGYIVQRSSNDIVDWIADDTGTVRMGLGYNRGGRYHLRYRRNGEAEFETVARTRLDDEDAFEYWSFAGLRAGRDTGYTFAIPEGGDRRAAMAFNFATGQPGEVIFQSAEEDVSGIILDDDGMPIGVSYSGESYRRDWIDPELRRLRDMLGSALPESRVTIIDISDERERMLVLQAGPSDPGALYVFTPSTRALDLFAEFRPQVPSAMLSEPRLLRYEARDGTSIPAILTLPRGRGEQSLPLIVYPHGGPYGIRDTHSYDDTAQLLANRGYAVLQPNFRGSGGYGEAFELLGNGQIGRAMQDDLDDGVAHLVAEGIADPDRVCIMGASYGGFAALWGAIRNPEIYRCGISFAGVTHFERQLHYNTNFLFGRNKGRFWNKVDGDQTNFDLDDVSPAVQVSRLTRPVLLMHGEEDEIVPYNQYELMVDRADDANVELETLSFEEAGHGFSNPEDEEAYYDAIVDFLARHNPAD